ncbi:hypothetical protein C9374_008743 [Naegleria lovaniensis]|uniref:RUN domain-containing protein n=1 Tax=Naegleria lovaniensis TaxID=51637 RepID=A0AA88GJ32_NAELO|nr:uncharacterized protein C9374_008743 [Naegleria lovaniensis]KAG2378121.1 hypothetical protein C9374_008743 [Naegleria lovaniensis]
MIAERTTPSSPSPPSSSPLNHPGFRVNPKETKSLTSDLSRTSNNNFETTFQTLDHQQDFLDSFRDDDDELNSSLDIDSSLLLSNIYINTSKPMNHHNKPISNNKKNNNFQNSANFEHNHSFTLDDGNNHHPITCKLTPNNSSTSSMTSTTTMSTTTTTAETPVTATTTMTHDSSSSQLLIMNASNIFEENASDALLSVVTTKTSNSSLFSSATDSSCSLTTSGHVPLVLNMEEEEPFEDVFDVVEHDELDVIGGEAILEVDDELQKSSKKTHQSTSTNQYVDRNHCRCDENVMNDDDDLKRKNIMITNHGITTMEDVKPHNTMDNDDDDFGLKPLNLSNSKWKSQNLHTTTNISSQKANVTNPTQQHVVIEEEIEEDCDEFEDYDEHEEEEHDLLVNTSSTNTNTTTTATTLKQQDLSLLPFRSQKNSKTFSAAPSSSNVSTPQYSHPSASSATTPFKATPKSAFHLRNTSVTSDMTVYSSMYDDSLDPSLIQKYYDDFDDDDYFDLEPQKLTITSSKHNFNLNEFEEPSFEDGLEDIQDDLSPFIIQVNTNIKRQVNKIGGEETRPEVIGSSHSGRNPVYTMDHDDDEKIPSTIFGRIKIPRKSGEAKAQQALYKMLASKEGRTRAVSDVTSFIPKIAASISNSTRSAITPPTNSNLEDTLYLFSVNNDPQLNNSEHFRIRKESVKLVENLGLDGQISESHFRQSDLTLEKQRINFLHLYSPMHREKIRTEVSLVLQSLFRGYVARKKLIKGLVYMEYICTAALGHAWRMKLKKLKMERDLLKPQRTVVDDVKSTIEYSPVKGDEKVNLQSQRVVTPTMTKSISSPNSSKSSSVPLQAAVSPISVKSADSQVVPMMVDSSSMSHYSKNVDKIIQFQALCRGYTKKLSTLIRNLKLEKRRHLLTKSHPLIRHVYIAYLELLVGKLDLQKDVNDKQKLMEIDNPSTTNIIMKKHKLFPRFLENIYQLVSCNTKNKYRIMRRSLRDVLLESNHPDCKELVDIYDKQKYNLNQIGNVTHELDSESFEMKVFVEFLLDQGNVLPKILAQILLSDQVYEMNRHLFDNSFISKQKFKHTILLVHEQKPIHFSNHSKQIYTEKSPMTSDVNAVDIAFLCEELSRVFFDFKYTPALFEKRHYVFHSTVCELLELFRGGGREPIGHLRSNSLYDSSDHDFNTILNKIIFNRFIPTLYSMFSMELKTLETSRSSSKNPTQTIWDLIVNIQQQQQMQNANTHNNPPVISALETTIQNVNDTFKHQLEFLKKKKSFAPVELSKMKFKSLICYGLSHKILDKILTQILCSQSPVLVHHVKTNSLLLSVPVQNSIISGIVSLQDAHTFNFSLTEPLFAP